MPPWLTDVLKLVGLASPFAYDFAVYSICIHFDKRGISAKGKAAIANWLQLKQYEPAAVGATVLEIFDRIYSKPLLSFRAFARSAAITAVVITICLYEASSADTWQIIKKEADLVFVLTFLILGMGGNIISDYLSLFLVRYFLFIECLKPFASAVTAALAPLFSTYYSEELTAEFGSSLRTSYVA